MASWKVKLAVGTLVGLIVLAAVLGQLKKKRNAQEATTGSASGAHEQLVTPAPADVGVAPVIDAAAREPEPELPRGSREERDAIAKRLRDKGFVATTDGTVLEMNSKREGCKREHLAGLAGASGYTMISAGFTMIRCIGTSDSVSLVDDKGVPSKDVGVAARQLFADYQENEIAADRRYKGKLLRVRGKIAQIGKTVLDVPFVELATSNQFMGVHALFESEAALVALKKGQELTVRCTGSGTSVGSPMLSDCSIE